MPIKLLPNGKYQIATPVSLIAPDGTSYTNTSYQILSEDEVNARIASLKNQLAALQTNSTAIQAIKASISASPVLSEVTQTSPSSDENHG